MPRTLTTQIQNALAADVVRPVYLAYFDFAGGAVRTWTGPGDLSYDSQTWSSNGVVTRWPTITESIHLVANNSTLELSGNFAYGVDIADPAIYRARTCEIYLGFLDGNGALPSTHVVKVFSGRMAQIGFVEDGEVDAYSLTVESRLVDLTKAKVTRYTHQAQLQRYPGDKGLEYAGNAQASLFLSRGETPEQPFSRKIIYGESRTDGAVVFIATSGSGSRYLNLVVAFADHPCQSIEQLYLDDRPVLNSGSVAGEFVDVVEYHPHLGSDTQTVETALQAEVGNTVWTDAHRLRGITYVYLRILYSEDLFGDAAPRVSARIKGKPLYDPRTQSTAWSDNAALAIRDYLLSENYGFSSGTAEVDDASVAIAANDCDQRVTNADGSTEPRYAVNGVLDTATTIGENLKVLRDALAGNVTYFAGVFSVRAGVYLAVSDTIDDSDLIEEMNFRSRNLREAYNGARGLYRTPALDWQEEDYPAYQLAAALTADGEPRWLDLPLPLTTSASRCQRIAKIAVMHSRAARTVELGVKLAALASAPAIPLPCPPQRAVSAPPLISCGRSVYSWAFAHLRMELLEVAAADYAFDPATDEAVLTTPEEPADSILAWTLARLASPSVSPGSQSFTASFSVTVTHNETGVTCHYTTDGSEPTESDPSVANGGSISISSQDVTLKLKNFQTDGSLTSGVVTYEYTYAPPVVSLNPPRFYYSNLYTNNLSSAPNLLAESINNDRKLYVSTNSGASFSLANGDADVGEKSQVASLSNPGFNANAYRAYVTNQSGDATSNIVTCPGTVLLQAAYPGYANARVRTLQGGCTIYRRINLYIYADGKIRWWSSSWGDWYADVQSTVANKWYEFDNYNYGHRLTIDGWYSSAYRAFQFYASKPGLSNSVIHTMASYQYQLIGLPTAEQLLT